MLVSHVDSSTLEHCTFLVRGARVVMVEDSFGDEIELSDERTKAANRAFYLPRCY